MIIPGTMIFVDLQKRIQIQLTFSQSHPVQ